MKTSKAITILLIVEIIFVFGILTYKAPTLSLEAKHKSSYADYSYCGIIDPIDIIETWKVTSKEYSNHGYKIFFQKIDHKIAVVCIGFSLDTNRFSYVYALGNETYFFVHNHETNCFERRNISKKTKEGFKRILAKALNGCDV